MAYSAPKNSSVLPGCCVRLLYSLPPRPLKILANSPFLSIYSQLAGYAKILGPPHDLAKRSCFTIADLVAANGFGQRLKYHQSVVQDQMTEQQELMERRRQELVSATQQKRVLEILREKHELREKEKLQREETFELDEVSLNLRRYRQES